MNLQTYPVAHATPLPVPKDFNGSFLAPTSSAHLQRNQELVNIDDNQVWVLSSQGYTAGLAKSLAKTCSAFPLRIWIVDNSGSMHKPDGHRMVETGDTSVMKMVDCTRWAELRECIAYHIKMAGLLQATSHFRLLNNPGANVGSQEFGVAASSHGMIPQEVDTAMRIIQQASPSGSTPLTQHVREIHRIVQNMAPDLVANGHRVSIVLATDGLPTDSFGVGGTVQNQEFVDSLRLLEGLPVWVVIRLCTDEDQVVEFYNDLDEQLELSLEVLDDFVGEANEVYQYNSWLTYGLPLHRCREMGYHDRVFDMLDERPLTKGEIRDVCVILFGEDKFDGVVDPLIDWDGFLRSINQMMKEEELQYNPIKGKMTPWVDITQLTNTHGDKSGCACTIM